MQAQDIINETSSQLNDEGFVTWTEADHLRYISSAENVIVSLRPDAYSQITTMQLAAGALQTVPSTALRLLDIKRNMGSDGSTPGRIVRVVDEDSLDLFDFNWNNATQVAEIKSFTYDERVPNNFYVDPPSDGTGYIEIAISRVPPVVSASSQTLVLKDIYKDHIIQWVMFRAYSVEVDSAISRARAADHLDTFFNLMGRKFVRDVQFSSSAEVQGAVSQSGG